MDQAGGQAPFCWRAYLLGPVFAACAMCGVGTSIKLEQEYAAWIEQAVRRRPSWCVRCFCGYRVSLWDWLS